MTSARQLITAALLLAGPLAAAAQTQPAQAPPVPAIEAAAVIEKGSTVQLEYTLRDDAGAMLDTNRGQSPLTYTQGKQQIIPGLERELTGMHTGDEKKVVVKPEDAYGAVNPEAQTEVPKEVLPPDSLTVGTTLMARTAAGEVRPVTVKEIKDKTVLLDLNHPLAGKTLFFEVKVLGVEPPKAAGPKPSN